MTGRISIETEINRSVPRIRIPVHSGFHNALVRVWIEVVDERRPHARHRRAEVDVRLRHPGKRFAVVIPQSGNVVEHKRYLLEMGHAGKEWRVCRVHVKAVAVCGR